MISAAVSADVGLHSHVQRGVLGVGEAPLGAVELHGRHAEIEQHAVHRFLCGVTGLGQCFGETVIPACVPA